MILTWALPVTPVERLHSGGFRFWSLSTGAAEAIAAA